MNNIEQYLNDHLKFVMHSVCDQRVTFQGTRDHINPEYDSVDQVGAALELAVTVETDKLDLKDGQKYEYVIKASRGLDETNDKALFGYVIDALEQAGFPTDEDAIHAVLKDLESARDVVTHPALIVEQVQGEIAGIYASEDLLVRAIRRERQGDEVVTFIRDEVIDIAIKPDVHDAIAEIDSQRPSVND